MYVAIRKTDENSYIVTDQSFPLEHPVHQEYFIFEVDNNLNIDEVVRIAKIRRAALLSNSTDPARPLFDRE